MFNNNKKLKELEQKVDGLASRNLYVMFDTVAQESSPIFEAISDDVACRKVAHEFHTMPPHLINDHELHCIGFVSRLDGQTQLYAEEARVVDFKPLWHVFQGILRARKEQEAHNDEKN